MSNTIVAKPSPVAGNAYAEATGHDRRTLDAIFQHPLSHNLQWRDVVALLTGIGDIDERRSGEYSLHAGGERLSLHKPRAKDVPADDVVHLRRFLERAGWAPNASAQTPVDDLSGASSVIVVIDYSGAKVVRLPRKSAPSSAASSGPLEVHHLVRQLARDDHDRDHAPGHDRDHGGGRNETYSRDEQFFEDVATAMAGTGDIVLIGHGKGQSNEADHLNKYLQSHHKDVHARIVQTIVADLSHLTMAELLKLGATAR